MKSRLVVPIFLILALMLSACSQIVSSDGTPSIPVLETLPPNSETQHPLPSATLPSEAMPVGNNLFSQILGIVPPLPAGWQVAPCQGDAPYLCLSVDGVPSGATEMLVYPLENNQDILTRLTSAGIPPQSTDYADPVNAAAVRTVLSAVASENLSIIEKDRTAGGETFESLPVEEIQAGLMPGVLSAFKTTDRSGRLLEYVNQYMAVSNNAVYVFALSYDGNVSSYASPELVDAFKPYFAQILSGLRLPQSTVSLTGSVLPPSVSLILQNAAGDIVSISAVGVEKSISADPGVVLSAAGYDGRPLNDGPLVYAAASTGDTRYYAIDTLQGALIPLDFVQSQASPLAVRPLTDETVFEYLPLSLAWGQFIGDGGSPTSRLNLSAPDGSDHTVAYEEQALDAGITSFVPLSWHIDGRVYFTREPLGLGGFIPFVSAPNLWEYRPVDGTIREIYPEALTGSQFCIGDFDPHLQLLAHHCTPGQVTLVSLETAQEVNVALPAGIDPNVLRGSLRLSPSGNRFTLVIFTGAPELPASTVYFGEVGGSLRPVSGLAADVWYTVPAWLDENTIILQSHSSVEGVTGHVLTAPFATASASSLAEGVLLGVVP